MFIQYRTILRQNGRKKTKQQVSVVLPSFLLIKREIHRFNKRIMKNIRNFPEFTHFACLPFTTEQQRTEIKAIQEKITGIVEPHYPPAAFIISNYNLAHVTLSMLVLHRQDTKAKFKQIFSQISEQLSALLANTALTFNKVGYFSKLNPKTKKKEVSLIYLQIKKDEEFKKVVRAGDLFVRAMMKAEVIANNELKQMRIFYDHNQNLFKAEEYHLSLFRVKDVVDDEQFLELFKQIQAFYEPLCFDCISFDISTRSNYDQNNFYLPFEQIKLERKQ